MGLSNIYNGAFLKKGPIIEFDRTQNVLLHTVQGKKLAHNRQQRLLKNMLILFKVLATFQVAIDKTLTKQNRARDYQNRTENKPNRNQLKKTSAE